VIAAEPHRSRGHTEPHVQGWLVSLLLHGTVVLAALLIVKQIQFAPRDEPFKWNVAMVSSAQPAQPTASPPNQAPAPSVPSRASVLSPLTQQTAPIQTPRTTPSNSERTVTPVVTEPPAPIPPQPMALSPSLAHTTQAAEPTTSETVAPMVAKATPLEKPAEALAPFYAESGAQTALSNAPTKRDYGWLSEAILLRVEELKRYPPSARVDQAEGKVVVKAIIYQDGSLGEVEVFQSSGHSGLDKAAVETMWQAAPFHLPHPLGQSRMTIKIPMSYRLDR